MSAVLGVFKNSRVAKMIIVVMLIHISPGFESLTTAYLQQKLKFSLTDLSDIQTFSSIFFLLALLLYQTHLRHINPQTLYTITNFFLWMINISFLLVIFNTIQSIFRNMKIFCLFFQGIDVLIAELNFLPLMAIWAKLSPENLEATSITLFTGMINLSNNISNYFGSFLLWLTEINQSNIELIYIPIMIQNAYLLIMIFFVLLLDFPTRESLSQEDKQLETTLDETQLE